VVILADEEGLHVGEGVDHCEQACEGDGREEELVAVQGVEAQQTLAHVDQALCNPDNKELVCVVGIVRCKVAEISCESRVVGACSDQT